MAEQTPKKPRTSTTAKPRKPKAEATGSKSVPQKSSAKPQAAVKPTTKPQTSKRYRAWQIVLGVLVVAILSAAGFGYWALWQSADLPANGYRLKVERGTGYQDALLHLQQQGKIPQLSVARWYLRHQHPKALQAGVYVFKPPLSIAGLLRQLAAGEGLMVTRITVIEGTTFAQLRTQLMANKEVTHTLTDVPDQEVLGDLGLTASHPEGLFAPDTYTFMPEEKDVVILRRLYDQQQKILDKAWAGRAPNLPYKTPYEALIMASIVEKETASSSERPQIAGVFIRRLAKGMRLQTDPTVIYGMGAAYQGNITKADLQTYTPYNTYRIDGLPPTPIALPSKAAIEAALHPDQGDSLYFVARGDGSGKHVFTNNLAAHNQAVAAYLQARRQAH